MSGNPIEDLPMPVHPVLRQVAEELERHGHVGEIYDDRWRIVYISSEMWRFATGGRVTAEMYGIGPVRRTQEFRDWPPPTEQGLLKWGEVNLPYMLHALPPGSTEFEEEFGPLSKQVEQIEPKPPPALWTVDVTFAESFHGGFTARMHAFRLDREDGSLLGTIWFHVPALPGSLTWLLARGEGEMYERMAAMREPQRTPTALLFCDIEASGELSRRLSSKAYFNLIREVTTAIDREVASRRGIVGKHAGDGASAFFCVHDHGGSESATCRSAIETARAVREAVGGLEAAGDEPVAVNCGIHWGSTVMIGQVAEIGRLEITALGDEVNEAARIEAVARGGVALASKHAIERLESADAEALGLDLERVSYRTVASLEGAEAKAVRDAGAIPVTEV